MGRKAEVVAQTQKMLSVGFASVVVPMQTLTHSTPESACAHCPAVSCLGIPLGYPGRLRLIVSK